MKKLYLLITILCSLGLGIANAQYSDLFDFNTQSTGEGPWGSLTISGNQLFGMAQLGGKAGGLGYGTIFSVHTDGSAFKELLVFNDTDGYEPEGKLVLLGNRLFGMASIGGALGYGDIFSIDTTGHGFKDLFDFNITDGYNAVNTLVFSGDRLFGMTYYGGLNSAGCIFSIDTSGKMYKKLYDFNGGIKTDGIGPHGGLIAIGTRLYGMTIQGGIYDKGSVFSIDSTGSGYTDLHNFNDTLGNGPWGSLINAGNVLFGMAAGGGKYTYGVVFSIHTDGSKFKDMLDFNQTNGFSPYGSLTLSGTTLYGTTRGGGTHGEGNIFTIDTSGSNYTDIFDLNGTNGAAPFSDVTLSGNKLYILNKQGGANGVGSIVGSFSCSLSANIKSLIDASCNGKNNGMVTLTVSGATPPIAYHWSSGETTSGVTGLTAGTYIATVTDLNECTDTVTAVITQPSPLTFVHDSIDATSACNGVAAITVSGGTTPYAYLWAPGNQTTDTIKNQCAGNYTCVVTDYHECTQSTSVTINLAEGVNSVNSSPAIIIYPNPGNGHFVVNGVMYGHAIEVYDYTGRMLNHLLADGNVVQVDISSRANGVYLVKIINAEGSTIGQEKVVKIQ